MKHISTILVILFTTSLLSQSTTPQSTPQIWEPYKTHAITAVATVLGTIIATKYPVEITPQIGPSINWISYDHELKTFHQISGTQPGTLTGFSTGATIGVNRSGYNIKSGIFFESKGMSYHNEFESNGKNYVSDGFIRLNFFTIPMMVGIQTEVRKTTLSLNLGGFVSLPVSELHRNTTNGITSDYEPLETIGVDAGIISDIGLEIPINQKISITTNTRFLSGFKEPLKTVGIAYLQSAQLLIGITIKPNKE